MTLTTVVSGYDCAHFLDLDFRKILCIIIIHL